MIQKTVCFICRVLFSARYKVEIKNFSNIIKKGKNNILFLSNHPSLIDPILFVSYIYPVLKFKILGDKDQVSRPIIKKFAKHFNVIQLQRTVKYGKSSIKKIKEVLLQVSEMISKGENIFLFPSGHIIKNKIEEIGGNSGVVSILNNCKDQSSPRVVIVKISGLWGSAFSRANGMYPSVAKVLKNALKIVLLNFIFFVPKRKITIEFFEPNDFPFSASKKDINTYIEKYFNFNPTPNTFVPYYFFEGNQHKILPDPVLKKIEFDLSKVSDTVQNLVYKKLKEVSGVSEFEVHHKLSNELNLDSLTRLEIVLWIEQEFGFIIPNPESLETVADVIGAAAGEVLSNEVKVLKSVSSKWFSDNKRNNKISIPSGENIAIQFLNKVFQNPSKHIIADQMTGTKSYRDILTAVNVLSTEIKKLNTDYIGIMMPATTVSNILYLSVIFASKIPVLINWTTGERTVKYLTELLNISTILTSEKLIKNLENKNIVFSHIKKKFLFLENLKNDITLLNKLSGKLKSYKPFASKLFNVKVNDIAAVLFTSGSESFPKAVPLTHKNIISNISDIAKLNILNEDDAMLGFLPPFHSFGLTVTIIMPMLCGIKTVYHPNPTESGTLVKMIDMYKVNLLIGTPTFVNGIIRAGTKDELSSLRLAVTGAEKCPASVYELLKNKCPDMTVLEGYGITECSPIVSANLPEANVVFSIGKVLPSLDYVILNVDTLNKCKFYEQGMLYLSGPSIFDGYLCYDGPSPFIYFEGKKYYKTGDLVYENEDGILFFKGRLKRFVKLAGEMISMPAIEETLLNHFAQSHDTEVVKESEDKTFQPQSSGDETVVDSNKSGPVLAVESVNDENPEIILFTVKDISRELANNVLKNAGFSSLHNIRKVIKVNEIPVLGTGKTDYLSLLKLI